jgi:serine protease
MNKIFVLCFFFAGLFSLSSQKISPYHVDGSLFVKFRNSYGHELGKTIQNQVAFKNIPALRSLVAKFGITKVSRPFYQASDDAHLPLIIRLEFDSISKTAVLIKTLSKLPQIEYAEPERLNLSDVVPNDPLYNTSAGHLSQVNAPNAWNYFNGNSNVRIAIVDNAVMWTHLDLVQNTYTNTAETAGNGIDDDGNGYIDDVNGYDVADWDNNPVPLFNSMDHGTHCAGIAAARTDNSIGISGMAWNAKIIPVKASGDNVSGILVTRGYEGIIYAVRAKARIISCSWGNQGGSSLTEQYVIDYAWNRGCLIVASAGNTGNATPNYPGAYSAVYCVASVDNFDIKSSFSNFGSWVDICAPGNSVVSTVPYSSSPQYVSYSGTSMSTPLVSGLAALMLSKSPQMTNQDVINCISSTAVNIYTASGNGGFVSGSQLGSGRIDAAAAMACAANYSATPPVANFYAFPLSACPSTTIQFSDSSLYSPTSWSWVFQGGIPATSTGSNPVVQWASPGTYSVMLTVTNANGSSSKTKLSYITVSGPQQLPFIEGFEGTQFLPAGWGPNNIWNDNLYWARKTGVGAYGTSTACAMFDNYNMNVPGERDEMRSPKFDFSTVASARLRFDVAYARYDPFSSDTLEVKISTNCGATWTAIYLKGGSTLATRSDMTGQFIPTATQWRRDSIDISLLTAGQSNVMFSFINRGGYGQAIYLDNINIATPTPSVILTGQQYFCPGVTASLVAHAFPGPAAIHSWTMQGSSPPTSTLAFPVMNFQQPGTYTINWSGINGLATGYGAFTVEVLPYPNLSLPQVAICSGGTANLIPVGTAASYSWSTAGNPLGNGSSIQVSPVNTTTYQVAASTITAGFCPQIFTTTVTVTASPPVAVTSASACLNSAVLLTASGASTYSWQNGSTSNTILVTALQNTFYPVTGTTGSCSSTANASIVIHVPNLGISAIPTVICGTGSSTLNATGAITVQWNTGSSASQIVVSPMASTIYSYTGSDGLCNGSAQITIVYSALITNTFSFTNPSCGTCSDGMIQANISGGTPPYQLSWKTLNNPSSTVTSLASGCYTLNVADDAGCIYEFEQCISASTGFVKQNNGIRALFPNPTSGKTTITLHRKSQVEYVVTNGVGQIILKATANSETIDVELSAFPKGVYFLQLKVEDTKSVHKIVRH